MDLITVADIRSPASRADLSIGPSETFLAGGSWIFSEPQLEVTGLVDLTRLGWMSIERTDAGLTVAATCTFAELAAFDIQPVWPAQQLVRPCCEALLGSFKVQNVATVGGNICLALPAGPMTSLAASLDAVAVIWTVGGGERRMPVLDLVEGVQRTALAHGEVLRAIEFPEHALRARTGFRRIALSPLGRSGTLVIARLDEDGRFVVTITAAVPRPVRLAFDDIPTAAALAESVHAIDRWYDDAHGAPDWREAMSARFAEQLRQEFTE